jgi:hypothetical protein
MSGPPVDALRLLSRDFALTRQSRPSSRVIVQQHSRILVGRGHHYATVELRTGDARAHREARDDPREEHQYPGDDDYHDERQETDDYDDVIEGMTTLARTIRPGGYPDTAGS